MGIRHRVQDRLLQALIVGVSLLITTMTTAKSNTHLSATQAAVLKHLNSNLDPSELNCTDTSAMRLNEGTAQGTGFGAGLKASVACANAQADARTSCSF